MSSDSPRLQDLSLCLPLLEETQTLTLSTLDSDGRPRATPVFFSYEPDLRLTFLSDPATQHCKNLQREPRSAVGLYPHIEDWRELRGIQMQGIAEPIREAELVVALARYRQRFPFLGDVTSAVARSRLYRFTPDWVRLIDNRVSFGHHQEWRLA